VENEEASHIVKEKMHIVLQ